MAAFLNVCRFNPTAGGTTDWTYASAVTGYQSPAAANVANGRLYKYRTESIDLSQWELGEGAYNTSTGVLARTTVLSNSSGTTSKINFSTVPQVAIVALKEDLIAIDESNSFTSGQKSQIRTNIGIADGHIPGEASNGSAVAGEIGEFNFVTGSGALTSGVTINLASHFHPSRRLGGVWAHLHLRRWCNHDNEFHDVDKHRLGNSELDHAGPFQPASEWRWKKRPIHDRSSGSFPNVAFCHNDGLSCFCCNVFERVELHERVALQEGPLMAYNPAQILLAVESLRPGLQLQIDFELADLNDGKGPFISVWKRQDVAKPTKEEIEAVDTDALGRAGVTFLARDLLSQTDGERLRKHHAGDRLEPGTWSAVGLAARAGRCTDCGRCRSIQTGVDRNVASHRRRTRHRHRASDRHPELTMSLLGFDASGRLALGQLYRIGATNTVLTAAPGAYAATGQIAAFKAAHAGSAAAFVTAGSVTILRTAFATSQGAHLASGVAATFSVRLLAGAGGNSIAANAAAFATKMLSSAASFSMSGQNARFGPSIGSSTGTYAVVGLDAVYTRDFEAWFPRPFDADDWTAGTGESEAWVPKAPTAETWPAQAKQPASWASAIKQSENWTTE